MDARKLARAALCLVAALAGCTSGTGGIRRDQQSVPLFQGMGQHHRVVTTSSPVAQQYFDQGLVWAFAFNHDEAIRSFKEAARLDPDCAMAWWGISLCNGPHINNPIVPPERAKAAWSALQRAKALSGAASQTEQALIAALSKRYEEAPAADRPSLDAAYAEAMSGVWASNRGDPDVGVLYAEAMMDLRPWDLWTRDGQPQPGTEQILVVLEEVLSHHPDHPGANHLYIHALEASPDPARANAAADRLRNLVPGSGHLVHMPSHIDVLTGRWAQASRQNERAIIADRQYRARATEQGFYHVYMVHNHHMLSFASMMEGRSEAAVRAARDVIENVPADYLQREAALMDPYMGAVYDALKRFGRWEEIMREPAPPAYLPITTAKWRFSRGLALAALGELKRAEQEQREFRDAVARVPDGAMMAINPAGKIMAIADHMLSGEIAYRRGDVDAAVAELQEAVALEDELNYMEPPEWVQPVRHTLGAVLLAAGRYIEAERVYREDLARWPSNGWSLYGLSRCLRGRDATQEAEQVEARFRKAWARADIGIASSCLCVPKT